MYHFHSLFAEGLPGWRMAGRGGFRWLGDGVIESYGGPGLLWYAQEIYENFVLKVEWRTMRGDANSGVFIRSPPLENDLRPAIERGYEIQIDDCGWDPERKKMFSRLHITGAIYKLAPVRIVASRGAALWNEFEILVRGGTIEVMLNGEAVSNLRTLRASRGDISACKRMAAKLASSFATCVCVDSRIERATAGPKRPSA